MMQGTTLLFYSLQQTAPSLLQQGRSPSIMEGYFAFTDQLLQLWNQLDLTIKPFRLSRQWKDYKVFISCYKLASTVIDPYITILQAQAKSPSSMYLHLTPWSSQILGHYLETGPHGKVPQIKLLSLETWSSFVLSLCGYRDLMKIS